MDDAGITIFQQMAQALLDLPPQEPSRRVRGPKKKGDPNETDQPSTDCFTTEHSVLISESTR
jgi:hypothetical protein